MSTINSDVKFLSVNEKPEWELLDLKEETGDYEHELFSSVVSEFTDISGFPVEIYLMKPKNVDDVYGEATLKNYEGPFTSKILYSVDNSEQMLLTTFGLENDFKVEYAEIPKAIWERDINNQTGLNIEYDYTNRLPQPRRFNKNSMRRFYVWNISCCIWCKNIFW